MEPASNTPVLQPWQAYFPRLNLKTRRAGQVQTWEVAASAEPADRLVVLPTGYGKTAAGVGYYAIRRRRGLVNRCLWLVSSDEQRNQLAEDSAASRRMQDWFGLDCLETVRADGRYRTVRMHFEGYAEIFVSTYQTLISQGPYFQELLDSAGGRWNWLVVADEAHHLSDLGRWGVALADLPRVETLFMSATPIRTDKRQLRGVPSENGTYKAYPEVAWKDAIDEGAIRQPVGHDQEWSLTFENRSGEEVTVTTSELREAGVGSEKEFDEYRAKHDLRRFTLGFLDKIFLDAVETLNEKRLRWPGRHQMVVFAMSCDHAKFLANEVFEDTDWVGVKRSDKENKEVLDRFKAGDLPVLVQVDKVGEGFDHPPASVALFLNLIQSPSKLLQQLGRVLRRDEAIPQESDRADVFADRAHPVLDVVRKMEPDNKDYKDTPPDEPGDGPSDWPPIPDLYEIEAKWMETQLVLPVGIEPQYDPKVIEVAQQTGTTPEQVQEILRAMGRPDADATPRQVGELQRLEMFQDQVERAMSTIVSRAMRLIEKREGQVDKRLAGDMKRRLHGRWKRESKRSHDEMLSDDFKKKHEWLRRIDEDMREIRRVPLWLSRGW